MTRSARHLTKAIFKNPYFYAGLYAALIVGFGTVYSRMPGQFYAPYAKLEGSAKADFTKVAQSVARVLHGQLKAHILSVLESSFLPNRISCNLFLPIVIVSDLGAVGGTLDYRCDLVVSQQPWGKELIGGFQQSATFELVMLSRYTHANITWSGPRLFDEEKSARERWTQISNAICLRQLMMAPPILRNTGLKRFHSIVANKWYLTYEEMSAINRYSEGIRGDPIAISGPWRMYYFSVVVATTLGFGDIVPMTDLS